jgi:Fe-S-cluster-containing dehydrogenase component
MSLSRREFFRLAATGSLAVLSSEAIAKDEPAASATDQAFGVLVDTVVCIGCRRCEWACKNENSLPNRDLKAYDDRTVFAAHRRPDAVSLTVVNEYIDKRQAEKKYTIKVQCMHCNRPACASACIVGALRKDKMGPVYYDAWKCIGCRYCMVACPFQIPAYEYANALDPQVKKCTFCRSRLDRGQKPVCIEICPNEALTLGKRRELVELAHSKIKQSPDKYVDFVYGEHEIGGTSWMYLAGADFANTELPHLDSKPIPDFTEKIQHGIFKSFIPPVALYALLGLVMHALGEEKQGRDEENGHP